MTYQVTDKMVNTFAQAMLLSMPEVTDHYDQVKFGLEAVFKELETTCTQDGGYCGIGGFCNKTEVDALKAQVNTLREVLEQLAKLGNGDKYGNSIGNTIAINALVATPEQCLAEVKAKVIEKVIQSCGSSSKYGDMCEAKCLQFYADQLRGQVK